MVCVCPEKISIQKQWTGLGVWEYREEPNLATAPTVAFRTSTSTNPPTYESDTGNDAEMCYTGANSLFNRNEVQEGRGQQ